MAKQPIKLYMINMLYKRIKSFESNSDFYKLNYEW